MRVVLRSKIHRAWVTDANPDYVGSILIDQDLMDKIDLWNFEKVLVCDVTNGNRFETYAIAGERGSGVCSVQGAAARLSSKGNCLIILRCRMPGKADSVTNAMGIYFRLQWSFINIQPHDRCEPGIVG